MTETVQEVTVATPGTGQEAWAVAGSGNGEDAEFKTHFVDKIYKTMKGWSESQKGRHEGEDPQRTKSFPSLLAYLLEPGSRQLCPSWSPCPCSGPPTADFLHGLLALRSFLSPS